MEAIDTRDLEVEDFVQSSNLTEKKIDALDQIC